MADLYVLGMNLIQGIMIALCALTLTPRLVGEVTEISNGILTARYDDVTKQFSIAERSIKTPFVVDGKLGGTPSAVTRKEVADPDFGTGSSMVITFSEGGAASLELYPKLPFMLVRETRTNNTTKEIDLQKVSPVTFRLDLAKPAAELTTMGTGGLLPPDKNPGSYLFLSCVDPATRNGLVAGFISQFRGSGVVVPSVTEGSVGVTAMLEHGHLVLAPSKSAAMDTFAIGYFPDARLGLENFADAVAKSHKIKLRPKTGVYCSWYAEGPEHGRAGSPKSTKELAKFIHDKKLNDFGLTVIQLDDGWQDGPNIQGPATEFDRVSPTLHYKNGIAPVAADVTAENLTLGLWWLPFGRNHMQPEYQDKQDWFFKWPDGKPLRQKSFGGTCLDSTHPEVRQHLESISKAIRSWGVKYYKMDGLSVGAGVDHVYINDGYKIDRFGESQLPYDRTKTHIEALRMGMETIRKGAGEDVFFSGCCVSQNMRMYAGTIGLVDSMRVGPDFNHDGEGIRSGPLRGSWVYFLNGKVWWNDPDPTKVRTSNADSVGDQAIKGGVTLEQARLTTSWVSLANQFFLISDWIPYLPEERIDILKKTMASHQGTTRPVDYFDHNLPNTWLVTDTATGTRRDVLGLFNFYGEPLDIAHSLEKIGFDPAKTYHAYDFWADRPMPDVRGSYKDSIPANSCRVVALRAVEGHPLVISTSRHVTQGMIDVTEEKWADNTLSGKSKVLANEPYELRICVDKGWSLKEVDVQGVKLKPEVTETEGLLRVRFTAEENTTVSWKISFIP